MAFHIEEVNLRGMDEPLERAEQHIEGMDKVGSGLYARVYSSDKTPYVVKVFRLHDVGYLSFLEVLSVLDLHNPHLPRIHEVILYRNPEQRGDDYGVVYMEKLTPGVVSEYDMSGNRIGRKTWHEKLANEINYVVYRHPEDKPEVIQKYNKKHQELLIFLQLAKEHSDAKEFSNTFYDLHTGNIMWRGNTFVVTDPIA
jgi:hypothetical protein